MGAGLRAQDGSGVGEEADEEVALLASFEPPCERAPRCAHRKA